MKINKPDKVVQPVNENIRVPRLQLISHDGQNVGIVTRDQALRMAREVALDLVLIADQGNEGVPVAKIMDFGKALYSKKKKQSEAKKHQKIIQVKEIKLRPKIGEHDLRTKMKQAAEFLEDGKHVKVTVSFRGREMVTKEERGNEMYGRIQKMLEDDYTVANLLAEKDMKVGSLWSRIYYVKTSK